MINYRRLSNFSEDGLENRVIERIARCAFFSRTGEGERRREGEGRRDEIRMKFEWAKEVLRHAVTLPSSPARK